MDPQTSLDLAMEASQKALQINPKLTDSYILLSEIYYAKGQYQQMQKVNSQVAFHQAITSCQKAILLKPDDALTYLHLGKIYLTMEQYSVKQALSAGSLLEKGREALAQAIQLDPKLQSECEMLLKELPPKSKQLKKVDKQLGVRL